MTMTKQEASNIIAEKVTQAEKLIGEAEQIANEAGVDFSWGGPSYGMGGWFTGKDSEEWSESNSREYGQDGHGYWMNSSSSC